MGRGWLKLLSLNQGIYLSREVASRLDERRDCPSPPGLVAGANPCPVVAVNVFVE